MTVGAFLDEAALMLRRGQVQLRELTVQDTYGLAAAIVARDYVYRELARFLAVLRPHERARALTIEDAITLLNESSPDIMEKTPILANAIASATFSVHHAPRYLLRARDSASATLLQAADSIAMASEIITTHIAPDIAPDMASGRIPLHRRSLSPEATALRRGAQRTEVLGETARLLLMIATVDAQLATFNIASQDTLMPQQWDALQRWTAIRNSTTLHRLASTSPAHLVRNIAPLAPVERSTGPRAVTSWTDVAQVVSAARSIVHRRPAAATVGTARSTARLGFAITTAVWRTSTSRTNRSAAEAHGQRWRELGAAASALADSRDAIPAPIVHELDDAQTWIRARLQEQKFSKAEELEAIVSLQRNLSHLCAEIRGALQQISGPGRLLRSALAIGTTVRGGIRMTEPTWVSADQRSKEFLTLLETLTTVANLPVLPLTSQRAQQSQKHHAPPIQQGSKAWPKTTAQALTTAPPNHTRDSPRGGIQPTTSHSNTAEHLER